MCWYAKRARSARSARRAKSARRAGSARWQTGGHVHSLLPDVHPMVAVFLCPLRHRSRTRCTALLNSRLVLCGHAAIGGRGLAVCRFTAKCCPPCGSCPGAVRPQRRLVRRQVRRKPRIPCTHLARSVNATSRPAARHSTRLSKEEITFPVEVACSGIEAALRDVCTLISDSGQARLCYTDLWHQLPGVPCTQRHTGYSRCNDEPTGGCLCHASVSSTSSKRCCNNGRSGNLVRVKTSKS